MIGLPGIALGLLLAAGVQVDGRVALAEGEARIRYLGHSGWQVETRSRVLLFDYRMPEDAAERIDPDAMRDRSVVVFISHSHGDHYDSRVLEWKPTIPDITYVFGWNADMGPEHIYCDFERQDFTVGNVRVRTVVHDFDGIPEAAYVVDVDGITLFHSGDHGNGPPPFRKAFVDNLKHVATVAPNIDVAFIPLFGEESFVVRKLRPKVTLPMHGSYRESMYREFAERARKEGLPTQVVAAENVGDEFLFAAGKLKPLARGVQP